MAEPHHSNRVEEAFQEPGFDRAAASASLQAVHPGLPVLEVSARSGAGMEDWLRLLRGRLKTS